MSVPNFTNFPSEVSGALLSGSNGLSVAVVTGTPDKIVISAPNLTGVNSITATSLSGTSIAGAAIVTPLLNVSSSAGYGSVEVGGAQGGYIDFKKPFSDDSDLRVISDNTIEGGGYITNAGGAVLSLSGSNIGIGTNSPATVLDVASPGGITYDLVATEGAFRIGDNTNRIKMGVALSGLGAGNASIVTQGTNPKLNLGAGSTQALQETLRITGGNVGIGMDPSLKLDVSGTIRSRSNDQFSGLSIRNSTNIIASIFGDSAGNENGLLELNSNGVRTIQLFSAGNSYMLSGNVGIGTSSPSQKLSVNGNISADGIVFGSTGGTVTSKTLEDYEEGTWTPTVISGASSVSYTTQLGSYTRIGRLVNFTCWITLSSATLNGSGLFIGGLPYNSNGSHVGGAIVTYFQKAGWTTPLVGQIQTSNNYIYFNKWTNGSQAFLGTDWATGVALLFIGQYQT